MTQNASGLIATQPLSPEDTGGLQNMAIEAADQPAPDPITEAHLGRSGSGSTRQRARDRVNWLTASVRGPRILDIGCSEGMLELLLARAGHQVLGLDIDPAAIAAARDLVRREPPAVRDRIDLRVADALCGDIGEAGFDTVVLGEVLEHLGNPAAMLERATAVLKPGGRLVLTTPFGYSPHCDYRQEFRTTELVRLLSARFVIDELTTADGYFRVIAHTLSAPVLQERRAPDLHQLLVTTEEAAIASQHHLHGQLKQLQGQLALKKDSERVAAERIRRLLLQVQHQERVAAERVRRLLHQLEHQKRVVATAQMRMRQAQLQLKQEQRSLRQELGRIVEKSLSSPLGILRLPYRIVKVYRRARKSAGPDQDEAASRIEASQVDALAPEEAAAPRTKTPAAPQRPILHRDVSDAFPPYPFPERPPRTSCRVATILDEFSDSCFRYEADLVRLTKEAWREQIEQNRPAFLLVESAWGGNRENWRGLIKDAESILDNPLDALIDYCRDKGIPTVFWNKEDPPNFETFIEAAAKFDHVFTTDANCIERYRARLGHERIAALPFAAQPEIHNPIGKLESDDYEIAFAGTWYGHKHVERGALLPILLDVAVDYRLHIFDRMSGHTRNDFYRFPDKYGPFLRKSLPYPNILSAYRQFKVFLNVNSVTDSPTMFARRVFEILASSTAVVSTASSGIEQMLGDAVSVVHDEDEARSELQRLLADPIYRQRKAHLGYRRVLREHTYTARFCTIARAVGLDLEAPCESPKVSIILPVGDERWLDNALANLRRQRYAAIEPLWIVKQSAAPGLAERVMREYPGGTVAEVSAEASFATMLRRGIELAPGPLVTAFDPRDLYGPEFVGDLALALTYADADIAGKAAHFVALPSGAPPVLSEAASRHRHLDRVLGTAWLARRDALDRIGIDRMPTVEDGRPMMACGHGCERAYGADPYNYLRFGHADVAPEAVAACLDEDGSIAIGRAEVIV
jgi:SAM-dependent methyltransferase